jgi:uncharacterized protein (TIGR02284 family)
MTPVPPSTPVIDPAAMARVDDDAWEKLAIARTRTVDAAQGFRKMAEHAEPSFAPIVEAFLELHSRHAAEFTRLLAEAGHPPTDDGSLMGAVNRLVVATRALLDDIDADVLRQVHSGEENVADAYQEALEAGLPAPVRDRVAAMLGELNELLDDTRPVG